MAEEAEKPKAAVPAPKATGGGGGMMPALMIVVLMPIISFAMFKFMVIPMIKAEIPEPGEGHAEIDPENIHVAHTDGDAEYKYAFDPVAANVRGTTGTRYVRVRIIVRGSNPELETIVEENKDRMNDILNDVLRGLDMAAVDDPAIKNVIRNKLKQGFEHALKEPVIEEITIPEFVVQ